MAKNRQMGEIVVDHRASPGLPEDVAIAAGYDPRLCREGKMYEAATLTCAHCKCSVVKNPFRSRERHECAKCDYHYICDICAFKASQPDYVHTPFEKVVETLIYPDLTGEGSPPQLIRP
jgi:hypothetical protein